MTGRHTPEDTLGGIEAVRAVLAADGLTPEALREIVAVLSRRFGYTHVSIYLAEGTRLRLGAAVGYAEPAPTLDAVRGVIGRVLRTRRTALVRDVAVDPDYVTRAAITGGHPLVASWTPGGIGSEPFETPGRGPARSRLRSPFRPARLSGWRQTASSGPGPSSPGPLSRCISWGVRRGSSTRRGEGP